MSLHLSHRAETCWGIIYYLVFAWGTEISMSGSVATRQKLTKFINPKKTEAKIELGDLTLGLGLRGCEPAQKKKKRENDIPLYPEENYQV